MNSPDDPTPPEGKTVDYSRLIMPVRMLPQDANPAGNVHGGVILKYIDTAGGIVAARHSRSNVVTASIDRMDFIAPAHVGEVITFKASLNLVGRTSMEIGVRVEAENLITGNIRHTGSAYLTYVALDPDKKPRSIPLLILETEEDRRRNAEAKQRRCTRLHERARERDSQASSGETA